MKKVDFKNKYGPWALVVGSAEGMGACYAERFAEQGINIIAVDRREELLQQQVADHSASFHRVLGFKIFDLLLQ